MPILFIVLIFVFWLGYELRKSNRKSSSSSEAFWQQEHDAFLTPRKSIEDVAFVTVPAEVIPDEILDADTDILREINLLSDRMRSLADCQIADLSGYTNTELRLKYGAPNFTMLSNADNCFSDLTVTVSKLLPLLIEAGMAGSAEKLCRFALSSGLDTRAIRSAADSLGIGK